MTQPVDLTDLRSMTDGDKELELALFDEFRKSSEKYLSIMSEHCHDGPDEIWRSSAHALKGISYNLGAMHMGDLCRQAQDSYNTDAAAKRDLMVQLSAEYLRVKDFLSRVY